MGARHREFRIAGTGGVALFVQRWAPADAARAELLVVHGYFEHGGRYRELAHALLDRGIATTAVDLRGHGRSEGRRGLVRRFEDYHDDLRAALATITGGPRFVLGHSLGGLVVLDWAARDALAGALAGVVIVSPYLELAFPVSPLRRFLGGVAGVLWPRLQVPSGLDPQGLSRDAEVVGAYRRDPLVFCQATAGWYRESTRAQRRVQNLESLPVPLLFYYSENDPVASGRRSSALAARLRAPEKIVRERPAALHEILNEVDRADVHAEIRDWISTGAAGASARSHGP